MILKELTVVDYGVFEGEAVVSLIDGKLNSHRPIVVFYGNNGAGKTTLLEAMALCVYGRFVNGKGMSQAAYNKFLASRVHESPAGARKDSASVKLVMTYTERGEDVDLSLTRSWRVFKDENPVEYVDLTMSNSNGKTQRISRPDQFLVNAFPIGMSQLLFFDGEKIKAFAEDDSTQKLLQNGFSSLTGVDLVESARRDLELFSVRLAQNENDSNRGKWDELDKQISELRREKAALLDKIENISEEIKKKQEAISESERELAREGSEYAEARSTLLRDEASFERERIEVRIEIAKLCDDLLPFAFAPKLVDRTLLCLSLDQETRDATVASEMAEKITNAIRGMSKEDAQAHDRENLEELHAYLERLLQDVEGQFPCPTSSVVSGLSSSEIQNAMNLFAQSRKKANDLSSLLDRFKSASRKIEATQRQIERVPAEESLKPYISKLHAHLADLTALENDRTTATEALAKVESHIVAVELEREKELETIVGKSKQGRKLAYVKSTMDVLTEFHEVLAASKTDELQTRLKNVYNALRRNKSQVTGIRIDPNSFNAKLERDDGVIEDSFRLSAGEKQLYAIALLGAIMSSTNRIFPFLIDTPLARLDRSNRQSVVQEFLPHVGEQVVLFVTNTELTKNLRTILEPHIAKNYMLRFDKRSGRSSIKEKQWRAN